MPWLAAVIGGVQATTGAIFGAEAAGQQERAAREAQQQILGNLDAQQAIQQEIAAQQQGLFRDATGQGNAALQHNYGQGLQALGAGYGAGQQSFGQGAAALSQLAGMGPYTAAQAQGGGNVARLMNDPTSFTADPGYQFRLQQGQQALAAQASAMGGRDSGRAMKELAQFNQGLASQEFDAAFQRASAADAQANQLAQFNAAAQNQALAQAMGLNAQGLQGLGSLYQNLGQFQAQGGAAQANMLAALGQGLSQNIFAGAQGQGAALAQLAQNNMSIADMRNQAYAGTVNYAGKGMEAVANAQMAKAEGSFGMTGQSWGL